MSSITTNNWRQVLRTNFTNWKNLADFLELTEIQRKEILVKSSFILNLPLRLAQKIQKGKLEDPILKQFLPTMQEKVQTAGFVLDPVGDHAARRGSKLLHKYKGRALLVCTSACAMHCRYCFRQNFEYDVEDKTFVKEIQLIQEDPSIKEVILSGGDPLSLSETILDPLIKNISKIPHVKRLRFHSRFPIGIPERIDDHFLNLIEKIPQQVWFVIHCNHTNELDEDIINSIQKLQSRRVVVANQSVLLKGVNDDVETLRTLCETLVNHGILPYYLHQLDKVQGAAHFEISEKEGLKLIDQLMECLPGYAVPKYVKEIAGHPGKTPIII
jgi:EF-P beta-lysylation protein EpmB